MHVQTKLGLFLMGQPKDQGTKSRVTSLETVLDILPISSGMQANCFPYTSSSCTVLTSELV